jgi:hypothetical protein
MVVSKIVLFLDWELLKPNFQNRGTEMLQQTLIQSQKYESLILFFILLAHQPQMRA